jgi:hypothetical protein
MMPVARGHWHDQRASLELCAARSLARRVAGSLSRRSWPGPGRRVRRSSRTGRAGGGGGGGPSDAGAGPPAAAAAGPAARHTGYQGHSPESIRRQRQAGQPESVARRLPGGTARAVKSLKLESFRAVQLPAKTVVDSARPSASTVISGARSDIGPDMERISLSSLFPVAVTGPQPSGPTGRALPVTVTFQ